MKKLLSLLIILSILVCSLSSCSTDRKRSVITINETTQIDTEIFSYFLNEICYNNKGISDSECIELATSKCLEYVAVNTRFAQNGQSLSPTEKADISTETLRPEGCGSIHLK